MIADKSPDLSSDGVNSRHRSDLGGPGNHVSQHGKITKLSHARLPTLEPFYREILSEDKQFLVRSGRVRGNPNYVTLTLRTGGS